MKIIQDNWANSPQNMVATIHIWWSFLKQITILCSVFWFHPCNKFHCRQCNWKVYFPCIFHKLTSKLKSKFSCSFVTLAYFLHINLSNQCWRLPPIIVQSLTQFLQQQKHAHKIYKPWFHILPFKEQWIPLIILKVEYIEWISYNPPIQTCAGRYW